MNLINDLNHTHNNVHLHNVYCVLIMLIRLTCSPWPIYSNWLGVARQRFYISWGSCSILGIGKGRRTIVVGIQGCKLTANRKFCKGEKDGYSRSFGWGPAGHAVIFWAHHHCLEFAGRENMQFLVLLKNESYRVVYKGAFCSTTW